jgi:uncharacterized protein YwqG
MDKASVQAAFTSAGLSRLTKDLDQVSKASIRLYTTAVDEFLLSVGASKLGGVPDLPPGTSWPQWKGLLQSFIAQIRMDDVRPYDTNGLLPHSGMLWFFYDAQQQTFGADPADLGGWRVIFMDGDPRGLQRTPSPAQLPASSQFKACAITFASEMTLSQQPKLEIPNLDWTDAEQKQYETLLSTFPNAADRAMVHHRLLGHPDTIQDDMRLECQLASHGVTDVSDPRASELSKRAMDWQLLLQIDSDEQAGMEWGNTGMLYYWIKKGDLQAHHFDTTWLVLQSE